MPDPRILKSGDGWRVWRDRNPHGVVTISAQLQRAGNWWHLADEYSGVNPGVFQTNHRERIEELPRIAAALTALHEVLTERTTSTTNSQE